MKLIRVRDLKHTIGQPNPGPPRALLCRTCGSTYSAEKGDYDFRLPADHVFRCCGKPMILVVQGPRYVPVE